MIKKEIDFILILYTIFVPNISLISLYYYTQVKFIIVNIARHL